MIRYAPHPVTMFVFLLFIIVAGFTASVEMRFLTGFVLLLLFSSHINGMNILRTFLRIVLPLCIAIGLFMVFIYPETEQWIDVGPFRLSHEGLTTAAEMTSRIILLFTGIIAFFHLVTLQRFGTYLYQKNFPVWLVFILINGLKFVDRFRTKLGEVHFYQRLRGMPMNTIWQRWRATVNLLIPLLYVLIEESSNRAVALEIRGFTSQSKRTALHPDKPLLIDKLLTTVFLTLIVVMLTAVFVH